MEIDKELELAIQAAKAAGEFLNKREEIKVHSMEGKDIKLSSDKISEKIIMEILELSNIPILSEEFGFKGEEGHEYWIVDPLDGTINYYKGIDDMACVSIALWRNGKPILGVVYRFMVRELFYGIDGIGAYCNDKIIVPSCIKETEKAVIATGFPVKRSYDTENLIVFIKQVQNFKKIRMFGAAAIMGTFVACGKVDAYFEDEIMIWDVAAAVAIVNAAGGVTDLKLLDDNKCICKCFATGELSEDYYAKGL